jgi:hypothetical protein
VHTRPRRWHGRAPGRAALVMAATMAVAAVTSYGAVHPAGVSAASGGSILNPGETLSANQNLNPPGNVAYQLVMQGDGNLVLNNCCGAIWATMTNGIGGGHLTMQPDGNLVLYDGSGAPHWSSHTDGFGGSHLALQDDGNLVIYSGGTPVWASHTAADEQLCWVAPHSCTAATFAVAILGVQPQAPSGGVNGPTIGANIDAIARWMGSENGPLGCPGGNPLNTTQPEPGSFSINGAHVQRYQDANGQSCQYWGILATDQTLLNGHYNNILGILRNPQHDSMQQCLTLARSPDMTTWGSISFHNNPSGFCAGLP